LEQLWSGKGRRERRRLRSKIFFLYFFFFLIFEKVIFSNFVIPNVPEEFNPNKNAHLPATFIKERIHDIHRRHGA